MRVTGVSFSSDKKLARCEKQYSYRYDERLKKRIKSKGLYTGDWLHQLYEHYYRQLKAKKKPNWESKFKEIKAQLWDKLFDEEKEQYEEDGFTPQLAHDLMDHYVEHWGPTDSEWTIIMIEEAFEMMTKFGFPVRWKSDLVFKDGKYTCLLETKNLKELPDPKDRILAPQVHGYCWLLFKKGIKIDRIVWNYIRTTPVPRPKVLKNGSLSERKINTDRRSYLLSLKEAGIHPKGEEIIGVQNYLKTLPETLSLQRITNSVNLKIGEMFVREWVERARRAQTITHPLRTWSKDCQWMCDYKLLCEADMIGKVDRNTIIKKDFIQITGHDGEELK